MAKSRITRYYQERLKNRIFPEVPTAEEALEAIDYIKGIELLDQLQTLREELDDWMREYQTAVEYTNIPHWERELTTLQPIRRVLNENKCYLDVARRNFERWYNRQTHEPNIVYLQQQAI